VLARHTDTARHRRVEPQSLVHHLVEVRKGVQLVADVSLALQHSSSQARVVVREGAHLVAQLLLHVRVLRQTGHHPCEGRGRRLVARDDLLSDIGPWTNSRMSRPAPSPRRRSGAALGAEQGPCWHGRPVRAGRGRASRASRPS
jgi:hypothetical protein